MKMAVTKRKSSSAVIYPCKDSFIYSFFLLCAYSLNNKLHF